MIIRFIPNLQLGCHRTHKTAPSPPDPNFHDEDAAADAVVDQEPLPQLPPETPPANQTHEVRLDPEDEEEWIEYSYGGLSDAEEEEGHEETGNDVDDVDIGPEDGEEPMNHDVEILNEEGYGHL
jgi:hypothetical protein